MVSEAASGKPIFELNTLLFEAPGGDRPPKQIALVQPRQEGRDRGPDGLPRQRDAFTLVEVIISAALMALVLGSAYVFECWFSAQRMIEPRVDVLQTARVALGIIAADLRSACPMSGEAEFLGMQRMLGDIQADNIDFATHNYSPLRPEEADYCESSIYLDKHPQTGRISLWRRRDPVIPLEPLTGGRREEIAAGVRGLRFEYYDGFEWYDSWGEKEGNTKQQNSNRYRGNLSGMPEAIRVTLMLDAEGEKKAPAAGAGNEEPPLVFQTVVRLNLARSSSEGSPLPGPNKAGRRNRKPCRSRGITMRTSVPILCHEKKDSEVAASVLVAVLWCLALLFVIVVGILHTARTDLKVASTTRTDPGALPGPGWDRKSQSANLSRCSRTQSQPPEPLRRIVKTRRNFFGKFPLAAGIIAFCGEARLPKGVSAVCVGGEEQRACNREPRNAGARKSWKV